MNREETIKYYSFDEVVKRFESFLKRPLTPGELALVSIAYTAGTHYARAEYEYK